MRYSLRSLECRVGSLEFYIEFESFFKESGFKILK